MRTSSLFFLTVALLAVQSAAVAANEPVKQEWDQPQVAAAPAVATVVESAGAPWTAWLWWLLIAYMFKCQATVCDEYFVESIKVVVDLYKIPEDVAGATLMALGCNGPELFTNFIAIFVTHSDVGVGTIVGSEIFNLLAIIGGAVLVAPRLPLAVEKAPFVRDVFFYALSIVLLTITLWDGEVSPVEAWGLLLCAVLFGVSVAYTSRVMKWLEKRRPVADGHAPLLGQVEKDEAPHMVGDRTLEIKVIHHNRLHDSHVIRSEFREIVFRGKSRVFLARQIGETGIVYGPDALEARTTPSEDLEVGGRRPMTMLVTPPHSPAASVPPSAEEDGQIQAIAPLRQPVVSALLLTTCGQGKPTPIPVTDTPSVEVVSAALTVVSGEHLSGSDGQARAVKFGQMRSQASINFSDVLAVRDAVPSDNTIEVDIRSDLGDIVTLVMTAPTKERKDEMLQEMSAHRVEIERSGRGWRACFIAFGIAMKRVDGEGSAVVWFRRISAILFFPMEVALSLTMGFCDCRDEDKVDKWWAAFLLSMVWLAVFSYLMVMASDCISEEFGIPAAVMGVTVCAMGTSFPNFWASIVMAREGRSAMAISNALGSNVQNIFLALALPWVIKTTLPSPSNFAVASAGIFSSVVCMAITLLILLLFVLKGGFTLSRFAGQSLIATYFVYLVFAIWQGMSE